VNKRKRERIEQKIAERQTKARSDSEYRQGRIKVLWELDEKKLKPSKTSVQKELKRQKLKKLLHSFRDLPSNDELSLDELVELVALQDQEIEYLEQFRRKLERINAYDPEQLAFLDSQSLFAELRPYLESLRSKEKPKQAWEHKRRRYKLPSGVGLIEYQFGGAAEAERRKQPLAVYSLPCEPTCLDDIFAAGEVRMRSEGHKAGLEELFGMDSKRFGRGLPSIKKGREVWYDYHAVVKIMHRLLSETQPTSKAPKRGKALGLWLNDRSEGMLGPNGIVARRVLTEIAARSDRLAVSDDIRDAFTAVVFHHIAELMELQLPEDLKNWIAPLVRRHLG
jgi:hypothetical protein